MSDTGEVASDPCAPSGQGLSLTQELGNYQAPYQDDPDLNCISNSDSEPTPELLRHRSYSCESVYMQCYDAVNDSDSITSYSQQPKKEGIISTLSSDFSYYRPTRASFISMDKITDNDGYISSFDQVYGRDRRSVSPSMQMHGFVEDASNAAQPSRDSRLSQVSAYMEFEDEDDAESSGPRFFIDTLGPERERSSSIDTVIHTTTTAQYHSSPSFEPLPGPSQGRRSQENNMRNSDVIQSASASLQARNEGTTTRVLMECPNNDRIEPVGKNSTWSMSSNPPSLNRDDPLQMPDSRPYYQEANPSNGSTPINRSQLPNQSRQPLTVPLSSSSSNQSSVIQTESQEPMLASTEGNGPVAAGGQSNRSRNENDEAELGLDSLLTSKAEKMDEVYKDKVDEDEGGENRCMWIFLKLFTWIMLVLIAASFIMCAKLSVVALSQAMLTHFNVSNLPSVAHSSMRLTQVNQTGQISVIPNNTILSINSTSPTTITTTKPTTSTSIFINQAYSSTSESLTSTTSSLSQCESSYMSMVTLGSRTLDAFVYSPSKVMYMDSTVILMWIILLLVPCVQGMLSGLYAFIRWQSVRRTKLSWRSVAATAVASLVEASGVCLFLLEVLPLLDAAWGLLVPALTMMLPSLVRLIQANRDCNPCKKIAGWAFLVIPNAIGIGILYLINSGLLVGAKAKPSLYWTLPVSIILISSVWMPFVLKWQLDGTYTATEVDDLDVLGGSEKLRDVRTSGLRSKHQLLCSFLKCLLYPSMVFSVIALFDGSATWIQIQNQAMATWPYNILHHHTVPYFVLNIVTTIFSPLALWIVFTAAIEIKLTLKKTVQRPVSGSFFVLVLTVILTVSLALSGIPCLTAMPGDCCPELGTADYVLVLCLAVVLFLGNQPVIYNVMIANHALFITVEKVFTLATSNSVLMDPWLWVNITSSSLNQRAKIADFRALRKKSKIYICTTMYREDENEMLELLRSIKRINDSRGPSQPLYEAHLFFDGALKINSEGLTTFNAFALQLIALVEKTFNTKLDEFTQKSTPYGIQWEIPLVSEVARTRTPMLFYVHLKDNAKVKKKKRWSQIMYMVWAIEHEAEVPVEDRYVLITDGDTKFYQHGPVALLDSLLISPEAAAVVGRVRPIITTSPLVWYQVFEYAASFWIYKASNDQLGTDLCCSGCFTMYRGSMLKHVIKDYAIDATNARDFLMIDMGEDLWLSTLLIRSGYKLKYSSVADVYTRAPSSLDEYYKQRRRWYLSSLAYFFFFIGELSRLKFGNRQVTLPYLFYQGMLLCFPLISTSTLGMVLAIAQSYAFMLPIVWSIVIVAVIFLVQHLFCLFSPSHIQIKASAVLSILPSLSTVAIVIVVLMNSCHDYIEALTPVNGTTLAAVRILRMESPIPLPSLMLSVLVALVIATGLLHPKEFYYIFYVIFYIIGSPVGYIFLRPYILCNVTDQSWGTRETKMEGNKGTAPETTLEKLKACFGAMSCNCFSKTRRTDVPDIIAEASPVGSVIGSAHTSQDFGSDQFSSAATNMSTLSDLRSNESNPNENSSSISLMDTGVDSLIIEMANMELSDPVKDRMLTLRDELEQRTRSYTTATDKEDRFWERLIELKLSNVETLANKQSNANVQEGLRRFQRQMLIVYFVLNVLWMAFILLFWYYFGHQINTSNWGKHFDMIVIIAVPYLFVNVFQFIAMFIHRMGIWIYLLARTKCRIGDFITCGYPTKQTVSSRDDVTRETANQRTDPRAPNSPNGMRLVASDGALVTRGAASPRTNAGRESRLEAERWFDSVLTLPNTPSSSIFLSSSPSSHNSRFQNSRWLLGNADRGMLTRGDAAMSMAVLSASQESLNNLMAARGRRRGLPDHNGSDPIALWAHTNTHLRRLTPQRQDSRASSIINGPLHLPRATPPGDRRYRPRGDTNTRSSASPLIRTAFHGGQQQQQQRRPLDVSDHPATYMQKLAQRQAEMSLQRQGH